jgi:hypothetical protein
LGLARRGGATIEGIGTRARRRACSSATAAVSSHMTGADADFDATGGGSDDVIDDDIALGIT